MLKLRVMTALVLGPLIIWSVLTFSHRAIAIELGLVLTLAAWEWARLSGIQNQFGRIGYAWFLLGTMLLLGFAIHKYPTLIDLVLYFAAAWWLLATVLVAYVNRKPIKQDSTLLPGKMILNLLAGVFILLGAFVAITALHRASEYGATYILVLLILIWTADSAAYFSGKAFGKHKLAMNVSPGKTWEGVAGAMLAVVLAAYLAGRYFNFDTNTMIYFIIIALVTIVLSIVGDLLESLFKRQVGIKDSSQLLPGHGGIMDRIDSLVAAAPIFLLGLRLAGVK